MNHEKGWVLVTGASSGIGQACALHLDRAGYRVFASVLNVDEGTALKRRASPHLELVVLDICDQSSIALARGRVSEATGGAGLQALVNNAGILSCAPLEMQLVASVRQVFEVNVIGHIALTQAFLPLLRRFRGHTSSRILNMGSLAGRSALPFTSPYNASKFALRALSDTWRLELKSQGIAVVSIEPGLVSTPIWQKASVDVSATTRGVSAETMARYPFFVAQTRHAARIARRRGVSTDQVARVVTHAIQAKRPQARYVVGREAPLLLALEKLPVSWRDWLIERRFSGS